MLALEVIEIIAESKNSWDDAIQEAINSASKHIKNIKTINIKHMQVEIENNQIVLYRIHAKLGYGMKD